MSDISTIILHLSDLLSGANKVDELYDNIYLEGDESSAGAVETFLFCSRRAGFEFFFQELDVNGERQVSESLKPQNGWSMSIGKRPLVESLSELWEIPETTLMFLTPDAFIKWSLFQIIPSETFLEWPSRLTILVCGLQSAIAGPNLRVAPLSLPIPDFSKADERNFPSDEAARESGHYSGRRDNRSLSKIVITSGDVKCNFFGPILQWAEVDAACLLAEETIKRDAGWVAIIRGENRLELPLGLQLAPPSFEQTCELQRAVNWIFQDNAMARHAILANRLAADRDAASDFRSLIRMRLKDTLQQAKNRYRFFVSEQTDKAAEELRDTIDKIRAQADVYASRSAELATTASRDFLASILIVGFGIISRIKSTPTDLLNSHLVSAFFIALGFYFLIIPALRVAVQIADLWASEGEAKKWIRAAQKNLPTGELTRTFDSVFTRRRWIYVISVSVILSLNILLSVLFFNWHLILASISN